MPTSSMTSAVRQLRKALRHDVAGLTDCQLLDSFVTERDEGAFETIVRRHGPMVFGVCRRILGSVHCAEDAFQAVFLVLARKAASISRKELLANWLYGVAQRTALAAKGKSARRRLHEITVKDMPHCVATVTAPCENWLPLLDAELSKLPEKYRIPIVLCDLEGRTRQETARRLKIPEGTLSSRLATARKLLAQRLARHGCLLTAGALALVLAKNSAAAAVPSAVISGAVSAAVSVAAGKVLTASLVSPQVAALAEGVLKAMFLTKLKIAALVVAALTFLASGISMFALPALPEQAGALPGAAEQSVPDKKSSETELQKLHGTWTLAEAYKHGKKVALTDMTEWPVQPHQLAIDGEHIPKTNRTPRTPFDPNHRYGGVAIHFNNGKTADGDFLS